MEEEHAARADAKMKMCFAAGCWGMRVMLWESSHLQVAKEPGLEFSCLVEAKPDPSQQLYLLASDDCGFTTASVAHRSLPVPNTSVTASAVLGQTVGSPRSLAL